MDRFYESSTSHARCGRGSSLTLGCNSRALRFGCLRACDFVPQRERAGKLASEARLLFARLRRIAAGRDQGFSKPRHDGGRHACGASIPGNSDALLVRETRSSLKFNRTQAGWCSFSNPNLVAGRFQAHPPKPPNKAPEPTPTSVMPRANESKTNRSSRSALPNPARVMPAVVVAHL